ncbi:uncharacterized protein B0P05DRAFT_638533 [Gilbertella persicaria]|uniref:uncharacterized protein n=1 Tax=Gilbertella persicaria TaxID=101096 RepID=UPI00221FACE1|nr:uncharacterized protein B0P05DRAFT_638533 [Gilbertella persicaria]KAI8075943.1 hypothetical protein B0P05DRAFT_638533 [Gilbertella persicaria]
MLSRKIRIAALVFVSTIHAATLSSSAKITPQDYIGLGKLALQTTYPACGMPYSELNLTRITAVQNINTASTCGLCLKVTGTNTGRSIYVLAVDLGGSGLDTNVNQGINASSMTTKTKTTIARSFSSTKKMVSTKKNTSNKSVTTKTTVRKSNRYSKARSINKIISKHKKLKKTTSTKNKTTTKRHTRGRLQAKRNK